MSMREQVQDLWRTCFDDDECFVELYFRLRYTDDINRAIEVDGKIVSALQAIPYPMTFCGRTISSSYISGACTHPDYRARGVMKQLLLDTHRTMFNEGIMIAMLIPAEEWLKGYYARSGYTTCFRYGLKKVINSSVQPVDNSASSLIINKIDLIETPDSILYPYFNSQMNRRSCCVQHTAEDFHIIVADLTLSGGDVWMVSREGRMCGLVLCLIQGDNLSVKELLLSEESDASVVFCKLFEYYRAEVIECIVPLASDMHELGMARIVDVFACMEAFSASYSGEPFYFHVEGDEAIPQNNGYYTLLPGRLIREYDESHTYVTYTISELTAWVMADLHPYMSLMLN